MRSAVLLACAVASTTANLVTLTPLHGAEWGDYKLSFGKDYATAALEQNAFAAYVENDEIIEEHNAKGLSYTLGHNAFSDMTWDEFKSAYVSGMDSNPNFRREKNYDLELEATVVTADALDWVTKGAVTPIKNQQQCGSCWAFSTTGSLEGAFQIATGNLVSFSEQELVSCDKVDQGCNGGLMDNAFKWIKSNGLCTEDDYKYTAKNDPCQKTCSSAVSITGFMDVTSGDEKALLAAVTKGPVSVAIEADKQVFQLYKTGVFTAAKECGTQLDHGVLVVGYGTDGGKDYWKVKNSWGPQWGEEGFIRMERAVDCCGVATQPSYPVGASAAGPAPTPGPTPGPAPGPTPTPTPTPGPSPGGECGIPEALACGKSVLPCLSKCKEGIAACIECLKADFATCCPCIEKVVPSVQCPSGPSPGPTPGPSPAGKTHYGAPPCESDEQAVRVQGISGDFCSPACTSGACPTDVPSGVTASPKCLLKTPAGAQYCALQCTPSSNGECGDGTCQAVPGAPIGICTYAAESFGRSLAMSL